MLVVMWAVLMVAMMTPAAAPTPFIGGRDERAVVRAIGPRHWKSAPARALFEVLLAEPAPGRAAQ